MDAQTANFIERMGLVHEAEGLPRIAGRILGLERICRPGVGSSR